MADIFITRKWMDIIKSFASEISETAGWNSTKCLVPPGLCRYTLLTFNVRILSVVCYGISVISPGYPESLGQF